MPEQVNKDLFTVIFLAYFAAVVGLVWAFVAYRSKWQPVKSRWLRDFLTMMVMLSVIAVIGERLFSSHGLRRRAQENAQAQRGGKGKRKQTPPVVPRRVPEGAAGFDWWLTAGIVGLIVVGGAVFYVRARMNPAPELLAVREPVQSDLAAAVSDAIDDLRAEPDARRAVIAAYARMEGVLARHGQARFAAETPFEYLSRVLLALRVRGGAVRELTELFERAKFSTHAIDDVMKERAISALVSVRDDLTPAMAA